MSGLGNLETRLNFRGGVIQEARMIKDKERTLKKALLYSYQSETIVLKDGRVFKAIINSDRTKADYDAKFISIPYKDICLGTLDEEHNIIPKKPDGKRTEREEAIKLKCGDVFEWYETGTYWMPIIEQLSENAYFKAEIYKCEEVVEINNKKYHIYIRGPVETAIRWNQKKGINWNDINYSLIIFIEKNEDTLEFFHRFVKLKIGGKTWNVEAVDPYCGDGILQVGLEEWYENSLEQYSTLPNITTEDIIKPEPPMYCKPYIDGEIIVHPFDSSLVYEIKNVSGKTIENGFWEIKQKKKAKIKKKVGNKVYIDIITGKSGQFELMYEVRGEPDFEPIILPIDIMAI